LGTEANVALIAPLAVGRDDIESLGITMPDVLGLVEDTYRLQGAGQIDVPTKIGVTPDRPDSFYHIMTAWLGGRREVGMKWVSYYPGLEADRGSPDATALIVLNDPDTGAPVAILEGMWITNLRTAACGLVAAKHLLPDKPRRVGLIGCGALPSWTVPTLGDMAPTLTEIVVTSRTEASRTRYCESLRASGRWSATPVDTIEEAVRDADIIISAVPQSAEQPGKGEWLKPGCLVIAYDVLGTWDDVALGTFDRLATDGVDRLLSVIEKSRPTAVLPDRITDFADLVADPAAGRSTAEERILAIPTGPASVDVSVGWEVFRRARAAGVGMEVTLL
jgi:alanine dehydrogenase